jgi:energy-coupling factor transport system ATP-binding protein
METGEMVALIGQNGSGKTTLSKCLNGLLHPKSGSVVVDGKDSRDTAIAEMVRRVGYVFQNPDHQLFNATCREEIGYGPKNVGIPPAEIAERVEEARLVVGLPDEAMEEHPFFLTKGLRQRVAIAAILALRPRVIIVDEPTTGQDARQSVEIMNFLTGLNKEHGHTIVIITHDMDIVARFARRLLVMADRRLIADGTPRKIFGDAAVMDRASLTPPQITRLAAILGDLGVAPDLLSLEEMIAAFSR